ncbi:MAG TPA: hypothetical protein ENK18_15370 [Deltaproteobacteria bacterium]|nr:hypothetical protein [Deltaproteobacteria bacterium]
MAQEDSEVTDSFPVPRLAPPEEAPKISVRSDAGALSGVVLSVNGDEIAVILSGSVSIDTQVEVETEAAPKITSIGVVIWSREDDGETALGIEIVGGASEWKELVEG